MGRTVSKPIQDQVCRLEPKQTCKTTLKSIPKEKGTSIPIQKCSPISKQVPVSTPVNKCKTISVPNCKTVNKQVPRTVCSQQSVAVARAPVVTQAVPLAQAVTPVAAQPLQSLISSPIYGEYYG